MNNLYVSKRLASVAMVLSLLFLPGSALKAQNCGVTAVGFTALPDLGTAEYLGFVGGLYPNGSNEIPAAHLAAGLGFAQQIEPLNSSGAPDAASGKYVLLSIGMSNAAREFVEFLPIVEADTDKSPDLVVVNGAIPSFDAFAVSQENSPYWAQVEGKLSDAGVTPQQVQAVWLKEAVAEPNLAFPEDAQELQDLLLSIVQIIKIRYPNVKIVYLSSRTYGGYATTDLNPEPFAYQSGFAVKWLIEQQINGDPELNYDPANGTVKAPWLAWGPYLWTDGVGADGVEGGQPGRSDGLEWTCKTEDLDNDGFLDGDVVQDGTHPSRNGKIKVATMLHDFVRTDVTASIWYLKSGAADNIAPVAENQNVVTDMDVAVGITLGASDANGDALTFEITGEPSHGGLSGNAPSLTYTPDTDYSGSDSFSFVAKDSALTSNEATVTITVNNPNNQAPVVALMDPVDGTVFTAPAQITITATASDNDGTIAIVEFFNSATKLGEDGTEPYEFTWSNVAAGSYTLTAIATDSDGAATTSTGVRVTVNESNPTGAMVPFIDMPQGTTYLGFEGGLYPGGSNSMPQVHQNAGLDLAQKIEPLDENGNPDPNGKIGLLSSGMSNASWEWCARTVLEDVVTPEFCAAHSFTGQALADPDTNPNLIIATGAIGGQSAGQWVDRMQALLDTVRNNRLEPSGLTEAQVQVVWAKHANRSPRVSLPDQNADAYELLGHLGNIVRAYKARYPNLKLFLLSSRIYAGYAKSSKNPEPYAYESGFAVKWLIDAQIHQMETGEIDPVAGDLNYNTVAPWLAWGPYMWADGLNPRSDGLIWEESDFEADGTHPSDAGEQKVGAMLLEFFKTSEVTKTWFVAQGSPTGVRDGKTFRPDPFYLFQNYPNPFNPSTTIRFSLSRKEYVTLEVFDVLGKKIGTLLDHELPSGEHSVVFDAKNLTSGVYFYRVTAGRSTRIRKALLTK